MFRPEPTLGWMHMCESVRHEVWTVKGAACAFCGKRLAEKGKQG